MLSNLKNMGLEALLSLALSFLACRYLGWAAMPVAAAISAFFVKNTIGKSFLAGFAAGAALWAGLAGWLDASNGGLLSAKVAQIFTLRSGSPLIQLTGLIGGLLGGLGAMTGSALRELIWPAAKSAQA